jgi:nitrogenase-stabilizing/protective protein
MGGNPVMTSTPQTLVGFKSLIDTEEFLDFFGIEYDPTFVNVNRLHILKQFSLLISEVDEAFPDLTEAEKLAKYGEAFEEAYELFKTSSPIETRLFKVFKDKAKNFVSLDEISTEPGV